MAVVSGDSVRRYPPLVAVALAVLLAMFTLPSALNLPQANPGQVAQYAPVPRNGQAARPGGNFAGLGLGEGGAAQGGTGGVAGGGNPGGATVPSSFDCVGNPPRQTPDPLSPPRVPVFNGDNGGATWAGVTGTTINFLYRFNAPQSSCYAGSTAGSSCFPPSGYYDMDNPGDVSQFFFFRFLHDWETYFNRHYQLYRRRVHVYAYNFCDSNCAVNGLSPDEATAEAADNYNHVYNGIPHMFAVDDWGAESQSYTPYLAQRGVVDFGTFGFSQKLAGQYPGRYWSFSPTYDRLAEEYASWVCTRVIAPGRVTFSGNNDHGAPRVYGLLLTDDPTDPGAQAMQKASVADLQHDCGFTASSTAYYHYATGDVEGPHSGWGAINMAQFRKAGVTTIIWPGGMEYEDMRAANAMQWYPEWVVLGDGAVAVGTQTDGNLGASAEPPDEESHVRLITAGTLLNADGYPVERPCLAALAEVDPSLDKTTDSVYACEWYDDFRQLYTGLQLAGPHLTPQSMDEGFHAIPPEPSTSPELPSCFYLPNDYTCVKDAAQEWWDPTAQTPTGNTPGCWRMWRDGARYLPGQWPGTDAVDGEDPSDVCNLNTGGYFGGPTTQ